MADQAPLSPAELYRALRQHLESLRSAGVEWVPWAPPPAVEHASALQTSLFAAAPLPEAPPEA